MSSVAPFPKHRSAGARGGWRAVAAVWLVLLLVGCGSENTESVDPELRIPGQFLSDSLGVALTLPDSPGWNFRKEPPVREAAYVSALHESGDASLKLYVSEWTDDMTMDDVVRRRRDRLAALFGVKEIDEVVQHVLRDERRTIDGAPVVQWQAITEPVAGPDNNPSRVVLMWIATVRNARVYECVGVVMVPAEPTAEQQERADALLNDVAFILQSLNLR